MPQWIPYAFIIILAAALVVSVVDNILIRQRIAAQVSTQVILLQQTVDALTKQLAAIGSHNGKAKEILRQMPDYLMVHDKQGRITYITPAAADLLGGTTESVIGTTHEERRDTQDGVKVFHEHRILAFLSGKTSEGEVSYRTPGTDKLRRIAFRISPYRDGNTTIGTVAVLRDITREYTPRF